MARSSRPRSVPVRRSSRTLRASASLPEPVRREQEVGTRPAPKGPPSKLPPAVARQARREMDRLRRLPPGSPEAGNVRAYLQWLWSTPWERSISEDAPLKQVERSLERDHLGMARAKQRISEYLSVRRLKPDLPGPTLCLVGPPGTGKSSLGSAVAAALRRPFARISVSGTSDASELLGLPRNVPGAQPGKIVRALRDCGVRNPVLMIDGVDRLMGEGGLGVLEMLLDLLDPEESARFTDHYLGIPLDLSHAVMLLCANNLELVPDALQERIEVIEVPGYGEDEKLEIARRVLVPRLLSEHGLTARDLIITEESLRAMVRY